MDIEILIALLPAVFMLHDLEELIFMQPWLLKNDEELKIRFPNLYNRIVKKVHKRMSTSAFGVSIGLIFLALSVTTILSLLTGNYSLWLGVFMIFFLHLFVHIAQWIIYKKYVPVIISSILCLPYCVYTFKSFIEYTNMHATEIISNTLIAFPIVLLVLFTALRAGASFEKWKNTVYLKK